MAHNVNPVITLRDIMNLSPEKRKETYIVSNVDGLTPKNIDKVTIDNNTFTDYSAFTFLMEKSYLKSPVRSADGSIKNLDSYTTFLTPHLKIDFGLMSIDSYRKIMKLLQSKNEFVVTCYDVVNDKDVTHKMYFSTEQMPQLWTVARAINGITEVELLAVRNYTIELVGTNSNIGVASIKYNSNPPEDSGYTNFTVGTNDVVTGAEIIVGDVAAEIKENPPAGYRFKQWNDEPDGSGVNYTDGFSITVNNPLVLYAIWETTDGYTLNYSYGLSEPMINADNTYRYSKSVVYGQSIGDLPTFEESPAVTYGADTATKYYPYSNGAWYKTPIKASNSVPLQSGDKYWIQQDSTIYLLYDTAWYLVQFFVDGAPFAITRATYNSSVPLSELVKDGYTFDGWYTDTEYTTKFSGTMPPFTLNLYGRWVKNQ